ncbi:hypothetical protein GQ53DRAFT_778861 [Thozetella sp. PMI_491]|nr:hypothetical protein GQ53DRAFT_778861 [Thozetella sp. PMI_491]
MVTQRSAKSTAITVTADEENISFNTNDSGLVKFDSGTDSRTQEEYVIVKEKLKHLAGESRQRSLAFDEMDDRSYEIVRAAEGTCRWLLQHPVYRHWEANRGLLWIRGKPGSGKSTLLKHALQKAQAACDKRTLLVSFFHNRGSELQKTPLGLFRSLLYQLLEKATNSRSSADRLPDLANTFIRKSALASITKATTVVIFIDALDECGRQNAIALIKLFESSFQSRSVAPSKLSICFSCRHYPVLKVDYGESICAEEGNKPDIATYVQSQLSTLRPQWASALVPIVTARASRIFIWACIVVNRIQDLERQGQTLKNVERAVQNITQELNELYYQLVKEMKDIQTSLKLIQWVCFAQRPLSTEELIWAMAIDPDGPDRSLEQYKSTEDYTDDGNSMERRIKTLSCGLVEFIHESVEEYFIDGGLFLLDVEGGTEDVAAARAHSRLSRICISYLTMVEITWSNRHKPYIPEDDFPFLAYAATKWMAHAKHIETMETFQKVLLDDLYDRHHLLEKSLDPWDSTFSNTRESGLSFLHILAKYGLAGLLQAMFLDLDSRDVLRRTPLSWAAANGHTSIVKRLVDTGKVKVDLQDNFGQTPLSWGAARGHEVVVQLFLVRTLIPLL